MTEAQFHPDLVEELSTMLSESIVYNDHLTLDARDIHWPEPSVMSLMNLNSTEAWMMFLQMKENKFDIRIYNYKAGEIRYFGGEIIINDQLYYLGLTRGNPHRPVEIFHIKKSTIKDNKPELWMNFKR